MVIWDNYFTVKKIWGFSSEYLIGFNILSLPLEEVLFFITVPYACIFVYEVIQAYLKINILKKYEKIITIVLIPILLMLSIMKSNLTYTSTVSMMLATLLISNLLQIIKNDYMGFFYLSYIICLFPFLIVNGILTNGIKSISKNPIVWYDGRFILGIKIYGIPIEDTIYCMFLLLLYISLYEFFKKNDEKKFETK